MRILPKRVLWAATAAYVAALTAVSLLPSGQAAGALGGRDKDISPTTQNAGHVPAYALLVVLVSGSFWPAWRPPVAGLVLAAVGCAAYGLALEWAQSAIPGRSGSVSDAMLNGIGAAAGVAAVQCIRVWVARRRGRCGPGARQA